MADEEDILVDDDELFEAQRVGSDEELVPENPYIFSQRDTTITPRREALIRRELGTLTRPQYLQTIRPVATPFAARASSTRFRTTCPPGEDVPLVSRAFGTSAAAQPCRPIDVEDFTETVMTNLEGTPTDNLTRLQKAVLEWSPVDPGLVKAVIRGYPLYQDVFVTFYWGLQRKLLDPNQVLLEAILWSLGDSDEYVREQVQYVKLVALALRYDADPDLYVRVVDSASPVKYHILYFVHDFNHDDIQNWYDSEEETQILEFIDYSEQAKNDIIILLMLAGSDTSLPLITIDKEDRSQLSYITAFSRDPNSKKSVYFNVATDTNLEIYQTVPELVPYYETRMQIIEDMNRYKGRQWELASVNPILWPRETLARHFYSMNLEEHARNITDSDLQEPSLENGVVASSNFLAQKTFVTLLDQMPLEAIRGVMGTALLKTQVDNLSATGFDRLLQKGAQPTYVLKDKILEREESTVPVLPLSAGIYADMLVKLTQYGHDLDSSQLATLQRFDPATYRKIMRIRADNPLWRRECSVQDDRISTSLRSVARNVGLDPTGTKAEICRDLEAVASIPEEELVNVAKSRQERRILEITKTLPEAVTGTSPPEGNPELFSGNGYMEAPILTKRTTRRLSRPSPTLSINGNGNETLINGMNGNGGETEAADVITETETDAPGVSVKTTTTTKTNSLRSPKAVKSQLPIQRTAMTSSPMSSTSTVMSDPTIRRTVRVPLTANTNGGRNVRIDPTPILTRRPPRTQTQEPATVPRRKMPRAICANEEFLTEDPREVGDYDLVTYNDNDGRSWCFLSEDYVSLMQSGVNPFTDKPLPATVIAEIRSKHDTLKGLGLTTEPVAISKGLSRRQKSQANIRTQQVLQTLKDYYVAYGVDPELLTSGYTIEDMQNILYDIYSPLGDNGDDVPTLDTRNRTHALYSFSTTLVTDVEQSEDQYTRLEEIFDVISRVNNPIVDETQNGVEIVEVEDEIVEQ